MNFNRCLIRLSPSFGPKSKLLLEWFDSCLRWSFRILSACLRSPKPAVSVHSLFMHVKLLWIFWLFGSSDCNDVSWLWIYQDPNLDNKKEVFLELLFTCGLIVMCIKFNRVFRPIYIPEGNERIFSNLVMISLDKFHMFSDPKNELFGRYISHKLSSFISSWSPSCPLLIQDDIQAVHSVPNSLASFGNDLKNIAVQILSSTWARFRQIIFHQDPLFFLEKKKLKLVYSTYHT